jgi:uncharacterized protein
MLTTGCTSQPKMSRHSAKISADIPAISAIRWIGDITAIALEWDPNHDPKIAGYSIYRRLKEDRNATFTRIAVIKDRFTSHYIDLHLPHETKYQYVISAIDKKDFESKLSPIASTITRPTLKSVVYFDSLDKLPRKAKLIWRPHTNGRVSGYEIERKTPEQKKWSRLAKLEHRLSAEYIDKNLDDNKIYLYRIRAITFDKIKSTPSDIVKIVTKALPTPISDLNITNDQPHTIELTWPVHQQPDIKAYHVYRSEKAKGGYNLVAKVIKPHFIDKIKGHGKEYYYKVTAVDFDALESEALTIFKGQNLPRPAKIKIISAELKESQLTINWSKGDDRAVKYRVTKKVQEGWFDTKSTSTDTNSTSYTNEQSANIGVTYDVMAVDKFGITSTPVTTKEFIYEKVVQ